MMGLQSVVLLTFGLISCFSNVHGLKCYICDGTMDGCEYSVSSKPEYLVECEPNPELIMGCISFTREMLDFTNPFQRLFQRNCFYEFDGEYLGIRSNYLPHSTLRTTYFPITAVNKIRKGRSIPPITKLAFAKTSSGSVNSSPHWAKVTVCGPTPHTGDMNGCNDGDAEKVFPSTEGYPIDQHISWIRNIGQIKCFDCVTRNDTKESDVKACKSSQSSGRADHSDWNAYGCATISVYQAGVQNKPYFRRTMWYPGDSWCINKHFPSSPTGRSLVQYEYKKKGRTEEDDEESCESRYARAFKARNSKALEESYIWAGTREFQTKEEYEDFLGCRYEVKRRLGIKFEIDNYLFFENVDVQDNSEPFASIGFHFCGPSDYCNGWSEERLHEVMKTNPTQKPIATKPTTSTTTLKPKKDNNTGDGEVPWAGCEVEGGNNGGNDLESFSVLGIFSILVAIASEFHRLGLL